LETDNHVEFLKIDQGFRKKNRTKSVGEIALISGKYHTKHHSAVERIRMEIWFDLEKMEIGFFRRAITQELGVIPG
jgi:hypothetical protein